jgi:hypothetical protein
MYLAIFIKLTEFYTAAMVKPGIWTKQGKGGPRGVVFTGLPHGRVGMQ